MADRIAGSVIQGLGADVLRGSAQDLFKRSHSQSLSELTAGIVESALNLRPAGHKPAGRTHAPKEVAVCH